MLTKILISQISFGQQPYPIKIVLLEDIFERSHFTHVSGQNVFRLLLIAVPSLCSGQQQRAQLPTENLQAVTSLF